MTLLTSSLLLFSLLTSRLEAIPVLEKSPAHPAHSAHTAHPAHPSPGVRILRAPESLVAPLGDEVVLECETSLQPERFEWSHRSSRSPGAGFKYLRTGTAKANVSQEAAISRLRVLVRPDTLGEYRCVGWFGPLVVTSTTARLELASTSLVDAQEPESPLQWRVSAGNSVLWSCGQQVQSNPSASWSYFRNGVEIKPEFIGTNGNLFLSNVSSESSGSYSCQATNPASGERIQLPGSLQLQVTPEQRSQSKSPHLLKGQPTLLQVNPKQIQEPRESGGTHRPNPNQGSKHKQMYPPTPPNVTRLTDESVMLRWMVPRNDGLPIVIFKVQYRMVGKRKNWQTTNDNIPYGKPKWNSELGKSFTASVTDLKPEHTYRFRILAVYSNNDNKESNTSAKFYLQPGAALDPMPVPELLEIEEYSETAVVLHWSLASDADEHLITGYYAYYRPSSSAGEYFKATIEGAHARSFKIAPLETATMYEFKLQSFSAVSASEFSALKQGRTQRPKTSTTEEPTLQMGDRDTTTPSHNETFNMSPMLTGTIGGGAVLILLLISTCLCVCRRRNSRSRGNNPNKPRMAELRDDFVPLGNCSPTKQRQRTRHIHITLNPLAQQQQQALEEKNDTDQDAPYYQRPSSYDYDPALRRMSSSSLRRSQRTLERAGGSNGSNNGNNNNLNQTAEAGAVENPGKPGRVLMKRPRLSSRSENLSSGSLNSVGV
ncbi:GD22528 [Drosophila simulans]|nr:GD22528 [Drosophila simulans]